MSLKMRCGGIILPHEHVPIAALWTLGYMRVIMFRSQLHRIEPNTYRHELPIGTASVMFHMPIKVWKNAQGFYLCPICHSDAIFLNPVRCQDCKSVFPDTIIWLGDPGVDYLSEGGDEGSEANANTNGDHRGDHQSSPAPSAIMPNGHVSVPSVSDAGPTPDPEERPQRMDLLPSTRSEPDINRGRRMDRPTSDRRPLPRTRGGARARFTESGDTTILKDEFRFIFEKGNFEQRKQEAAELVSALDSTANDQPNDSKQSHVQDDLARSATSKKSIPDEGLQRRRLPGAYFPNGCIVSSALNGVSCKSASSESIKVPMYSSELTQSPERLLTVSLPCQTRRNKSDKRRNKSHDEAVQPFSIFPPGDNSTIGSEISAQNNCSTAIKEQYLWIRCPSCGNDIWDEKPLRCGACHHPYFLGTGEIMEKYEVTCCKPCLKLYEIGSITRCKVCRKLCHHGGKETVTIHERKRCRSCGHKKWKEPMLQRPVCLNCGGVDGYDMKSQKPEFEVVKCPHAPQRKGFAWNDLGA